MKELLFYDLWLRMGASRPAIYLEVNCNRLARFETERRPGGMGLV